MFLFKKTREFIQIELKALFNRVMPAAEIQIPGDKYFGVTVEDMREYLRGSRIAELDQDRVKHGKKLPIAVMQTNNSLVFFVDIFGEVYFIEPQTYEIIPATEWVSKSRDKIKGSLV